MGRVGGREMQEGREMGTYCICITDSLCYKAEADTPLKGNYTSIKMFKKKKRMGRIFKVCMFFVQPPIIKDAIII